jgi:hypothetical protein
MQRLIASWNGNRDRGMISAFHPSDSKQEASRPMSVCHAVPLETRIKELRVRKVYIMSSSCPSRVT